MSDSLNPAPIDGSAYVARIPSYNRKPKFSAWVNLLTTPFAQMTYLANNLYQVFCVATAEGVQLDAVGLWVGVSRNILTPIGAVFLTFNVEGLGFNQGVFLGPFEPDQGVVTLDDAHYRFLIYARIAANNWDGTGETAQAAFNLAFTGQGVTVSVQDNADSTATVTVTGNVSVLQQQLILGGYIPLKPTSITINYVFTS
jgi:hypothetical protein